MDSYELPLTKEKKINDIKSNIFKCKEYEMEMLLNNEKFIITLKINPEDKILFQAKNQNNMFSKEYTYDELIKIFFLVKDYYNNINKILQYSILKFPF